jgi:hypothetical protein
MNTDADYLAACKAATDFYNQVRIPSPLVPGLLDETARWAAKCATAMLGGRQVPRVAFVPGSDEVRGAASAGDTEVAIGLREGLTLHDCCFIAAHEVSHALGVRDETKANAVGHAVVEAWRADVGARRDQIFQSAYLTLSRLVPASMKSGRATINSLDRPGLDDRLTKWYGSRDRAAKTMWLENELEALADQGIPARPGFLPHPKRPPASMLFPAWFREDS